MKTIIVPLMKQLQESMNKKLSLLWPKKGQWFPPEANITFEICKLASEFGYEVFGECDIGGGRADMILLHTDKKWICHVECKLINSETCKSNAVINDLSRLSKPDGLVHLLNNVNSAGTTDTLNTYEKYGLFVGADVSWMYSWWSGAADNNASTKIFLDNYPHANKHSVLTALSHFAKQSISWDVVPQMPMNDEYWIAYGLFNI